MNQGPMYLNCMFLSMGRVYDVRLFLRVLWPMCEYNRLCYIYVQTELTNNCKKLQSAFKIIMNFKDVIGECC